MSCPAQEANRPPGSPENESGWQSSSSDSDEEEKGSQHQVVSNNEKEFDPANIELHRNRYRNLAADGEDLDAKRSRLAELYQTKDWKEDHLHLFDDMNVSKFVIDPDAQRQIYRLQTSLVDEQFKRFGKTQPYVRFGKVWEGYTLMFRNGWESGDKRKPVRAEFQQYCEDVYCPIIYAMLFGPGWANIHKHYAQFKSCTIKVCENTSFYGDIIYHMHIDGKIGLMQKNNYTQRRMSRLLFSIVTDTLDDPRKADLLEYGATDFPIWQPKVGFKTNHEFHRYMQSLYVDRGLENSGLARPHYEIPENILYRAKSGEVLINHSHADVNNPQPIHSEPNPCPDRHLFVFDWNNILNCDEDGKMAPQTEVPAEEIINCMLPLADCSAPTYADRMKYVVQVAESVLEKAGKYCGGREAVSALLEDLSSLSK